MHVRAASAFFIVLPIIGASSFGCGNDHAVEPDAPELGTPVVATALDRTFPTNAGLVMNLAEHGFPTRVGANMDPVIVEARRFYDTLKNPAGAMQVVDYPDPFTGAAPAPKVTAPMTFTAWKEAFQIPPRGADESLADYRARANVVVYYNKNELGLGRELGCAEFDDGVDGQGNPLTGVACYVTNYGTAFRDMFHSLDIAAQGEHPKNTVCISWRPSLPADYQVQFYAYDGDGIRLEWAQLDTLGPRALPQVCMNCHGGSYDNTTHLAKFARFLPLDPNVVLFDETKPGSTRADQEEAIRINNLYSTKSPLTPQQIELLDQLYGGKLTTPGTKSAKTWAPAGWRDGGRNAALFDQVIKPNCTTCHAAMQTGPDGVDIAIYSLFETPETLLEAGLPGVVCGNFQMPNSQATRLNFWEPSPEPIVFDGKEFANAADVLLAEINLDRSKCANLEELANCNRGPDPDSLCGNAFSGKACDRLTGRCVPSMGFNASKDPTAPNGVCKLNGTRGCPFPQYCIPAGKVTPGIEAFDGVCMP